MVQALPETQSWLSRQVWAGLFHSQALTVSFTVVVAGVKGPSVGTWVSGGWSWYFLATEMLFAHLRCNCWTLVTPPSSVWVLGLGSSVNRSSRSVVDLCFDCSWVSWPHGRHSMTLANLPRFVTSRLRRLKLLSIGESRAQWWSSWEPAQASFEDWAISLFSEREAQ